MTRAWSKYNLPAYDAEAKKSARIRAEARKHFLDNGTAEEQRAVLAAMQGYGIKAVAEAGPVDLCTARAVVLGDVSVEYRKEKFMLKQAERQACIDIPSDHRGTERRA